MYSCTHENSIDVPSARRLQEFLLILLPLARHTSFHSLSKPFIVIYPYLFFLSEQVAFTDRKFTPLSLLYTNPFHKIFAPLAQESARTQAPSVYQPVFHGQSPTKRDSKWRPFDWLRFLDERFPCHFCSLGR